MPDPDLYPFYHGVASGDPLSDAIIIWTRITPDSPEKQISINWRMALDTGMTQIVQSGVFITNQQRDYTVKIDVVDLEPATCYYYDFESDGNYSLRGRTRTLPVGELDQARFAVMSCANYEDGYYNAYRHVSMRNDIDAVLHLGDYIYEYHVGGFSSFIEGRQNEPANEIITLDDYRIRHSHYKLDQDLMRCHQQHPWIIIWDDHEFANNAWSGGAQNHNAGEGEWSDRKANAWQSYFEWMPIREMEGNIIHRATEYGDLIKFYLLDTRIEHRDEQVGIGSNQVNSPDRTILGDVQKEWLEDELIASEAHWNICAQQVMMAPLTAFGLELNTDQWDGYVMDRNWLYNIVQAFVPNFVVLTGDIHTSWVNNLPLDNYNNNQQIGSVGVEFVCTSVTSQALPIDLGEGLIQILNPHVQFVNLQKKGYILLDVTPQRVQGDWMFMNTVQTSTLGESVGASYRVYDQTKFAAVADFPIQPQPGACLMAPQWPFDPSTVDVPNDINLTLISAYPNPTNDKVVIQFALQNESGLAIELFDLSGKAVGVPVTLHPQRGLHYAQLDLQNLAAGTYILSIKTDKEAKSSLIVKAPR